LSWITTNNLLARYNQAATLVQGDMSGTGASFPNNPNAAMVMERRLRNVRVGGVEVAKVFTEEERSSIESLVPALEKRLLQGKLKSKQEKTLRDFLSSKKDLDSDTVRNAIRLVMSTPEFQLT
jgi:hypothetical protein